MPLWEWILITASLAIPVTAVMVATTFMRDRQDVSAPASTSRVRLSVPNFANLTPVSPVGPEPESAYAG